MEAPSDTTTTVAEHADPGPPPWAALVKQHDRRVLLVLLAMGLPADEAREIAQATWTRLIEQQQRGALIHLQLPGLAVRQARFLAIDELRRRGRLAPGLVPDAASTAPDPEASLLQRESLDRVRSAAQRLSPSAQRVFRAVYESPDTPHAEIASRLGLSVQRVRQVLCEVRKTLRAAADATEVSGD